MVSRYRFSISLILLVLGISSFAPYSAQALTSPTISSNWSGYAATGGGYTSVSGTWIVPVVGAYNRPQADATWVGIGGTSTSSDLIQAGTEAIVQDSVVKYQAWYGLSPYDSMIIPLDVGPQDYISVYLQETSPDTWSLTFYNDTKWEAYTTTLPYASSKSSAEWIEEMPSSGSSVIPLDSFGLVSFVDEAATKNGNVGTPLSFGAVPISLYKNSTTPLATPSPFTSDGTTFSIIRTGASAMDLGSPVLEQVDGGYRRSGRSVAIIPPKSASNPATQVATPLVGLQELIRKLIILKDQLWAVSLTL